MPVQMKKLTFKNIKIQSNKQIGKIIKNKKPCDAKQIQNLTVPLNNPAIPE